MPAPNRTIIWFTVCIVALALLFALFARRFGYAAGFNPGAYPGIYNSYKVDGALETSGVISTRPSNYAACEFHNGSAASAWLVAYNSATVAGQTTAGIVGWCNAIAGGDCSFSAGGPSGPTTNAAIVAYNGLSWYASSTFPDPTQTGIGATGLVICTVNSQ